MEEEYNKIVTSVDKFWIVEIMMKDSVLTSNRTVLYSFLGITNHLEKNRMRLEAFQKKSSEQIQNFLLQRIQRWISGVEDKGTFKTLICTLEEEGYAFTAGNIKTALALRLDAEERTQTSSIMFDVPDRMELEPSREKEVDLMLENHVKKGNCVILKTIHGMGSTGLAITINYALKFKEKCKSNVIWINAESVNSIQNCYTRLANLLGLEILSIEDGGITKIVELVHEYIYFSKRKSLFVFDNVESRENLELCLPSNHGRVFLASGYYLVKTRNIDQFPNFRTTELNTFTETESIQVFKRVLNIESTDDLILASEISRALEFVPIAIRQAAGFVKMEKSNLKEYYYELQRIFKIPPPLKILKGLQRQEQVISITSNIVTNKIKVQNPLAMNVLNLLAYLSPYGIPLDIFLGQLMMTKKSSRRSFVKLPNSTEPTPIQVSKTNLYPAINLLGQYTLIVIMRHGSPVAKDGSVCIPPQIQRVLRCQNKKQEQKYLRKLFEMFENIKRRPQSDLSHYRIHIQSLWKYALKYDNLVKEFTQFGLEACSHYDPVEDRGSLDLTLRKFNDMIPFHPELTIKVLCGQMINFKNLPNGSSSIGYLVDLSSDLLDTHTRFNSIINHRLVNKVLLSSASAMYHIARNPDDFNSEELNTRRLFQNAAKIFQIVYNYDKANLVGEASSCTVEMINCLINLMRFEEAVIVATEVQESCVKFSDEQIQNLGMIADILIHHGYPITATVHKKMIQQALIISEKMSTKIAKATPPGAELNNLQKISSSYFILEKCEGKKGWIHLRRIFDIIEKTPGEGTFFDLLFDAFMELRSFNFGDGKTVFTYLKFVQRKLMELDLPAECLVFGTLVLTGAMHEIGEKEDPVDLYDSVLMCKKYYAGSSRCLWRMGPSIKPEDCFPNNNY